MAVLPARRPGFHPPGGRSGRPGAADPLPGLPDQPRDAGQAVIDGVNDFVRDPEAAFSRLADQGLANWHRNMQQLRDPNAWRQAYVDTRNFLRNNADVIISTLPFVGELYDLTSAILGRDPITGRPLSSFEKTLILAGVAAGVLTFGLGDEAIDLGAELLRHMDDVDAGEVMKAGRGLSRVDEAADAVRAENRLAREALVKADTGTGLNRADDALEIRLRNLADASSGDGTVRRGVELHAALSSGSNRRTLSDRLDAAAARRKSVFSDQCANSFTAGTPVETEDGQKPIEESRSATKSWPRTPKRASRVTSKSVP